LPPPENLPRSCVAAFNDVKRKRASRFVLYRIGAPGSLCGGPQFSLTPQFRRHGEADHY
jgi:hypothetical protein